MSAVAVAVIGGAVLANKASDKQADAAAQATAAQTQAADTSIDEQRRQFDAMIELLKPYVESGQPALQQMAGYSNIGPLALEKQSALAGLSGAEAQQQAINEIEQSPLFQAQIQQGEEALLQNASATGGLRGGNIQASLAQFRPAMLNQALEQQYSKLSGLTNLGVGASQNLASIGQASAAGQAAQGLQTASNIGTLLTQAGQAQAQNALTQGTIQAQQYGNIGQTFGTLAGMF